MIIKLRDTLCFKRGTLRHEPHKMTGSIGFIYVQPPRSSGMILYCNVNVSLVDKKLSNTYGFLSVAITTYKPTARRTTHWGSIYYPCNGLWVENELLSLNISSPAFIIFFTFIIPSKLLQIITRFNLHCYWKKRGIKKVKLNYCNLVDDFVLRDKHNNSLRYIDVKLRKKLHAP